jgi:hypothetical protein
VKLAIWTCFSMVLLLAQSAGVIEGRVTNSVTGEGVGGVTVRFLDGHDRVQQTSTDASGVYRVANLSDGTYRGTFEKDGFANGPGNPPVQISAGVPAKLDAQLEPRGGLRGRVLDEDGSPAAKISVQISRLEMATFNQTETDQNGAFAFKSLAAGSFTLVAKPQPKVGVAEGIRIGNVPIYYPSVTDLSQAVPIVVRKGADVSGIEIRLKSVPVRRVAGVVLAPSGKPLAGATVKMLGTATVRQTLSSIANLNGSRPYMSLTTTGPGPAPEIARVVSGENGVFEFPAVEQGDWRLSATLGDGDEMTLSGVAPAPVSVHDVEGIALRLSAPFTVGVTAEWGDTKAPAGAGRATNLVLSPAEGQPHLFLDPEKYAGLIPGIFPGRYRVIPINMGPGFYPAAVMWGGRDVSGQVVEIAPSAAPFQVVFRSDVGAVHGTVDKGEGGTVILTPRNPGEISFIRQEPCGPGGVFEFANVPPGDYYAVAFDRSDTRDLHAAEIPNVIIPMATSVRVESGSGASVELRLNRWPW